jgi:RimJ/RimL family protein N-acetyltransferase
MPQRINEFGQPIGRDVAGWSGVRLPSRVPMEGKYCRIEALDTDRHAKQLFEAYCEDVNGGLWTYMPHGPFDSEPGFREWMEPACESRDPLFYALIEQSTGRAAGVASYLRITPQHGVIEVGNIAFAPRIQKSAIATEAMFLMMQRAFNELGYRRYEWKCDSLNAPSRRAAQRLGFSYDGLFKQAIIYKGRNRDTAWFSILDSDWPAIERGFTAWLAAENFDAEGIQRRCLSDLIGG